MKFFYHHVGVSGSALDFPKTVFADLPISRINTGLSDNLVKNKLIGDLQEVFPSGYFNCWGVPAGASHVIKNLSVGDIVLLVETTGNEGSIPVLCSVKYFYNHLLPDLSEVLWGNDHFPYIFFFSTCSINLTWLEFASHFDFKPNFDPRGSFLSIGEKRLEKFGGAEGYLTYLKENYINDLPSIWLRDELREHPSPDQEYVVLDVDIQNMVSEAINNAPELTTSNDKEKALVIVEHRDATFREGVRKLYGSKCAICGLGLRSPLGNYEVQSAHIYPKKEKGSDDVRNGLCLCRIHHWAFDAGWISLTDDLTIIVRSDLPKAKGYDFIRNFTGASISKPIRDELAPHPIFLRAHRKMHGFE